MDEKLVFANSPSLLAYPGEVEPQHGNAASGRDASAIREAAKMSLPQVKQWANSAKACGFAGKSRRAARLPPVAPGNSTFLDLIMRDSLKGQYRVMDLRLSSVMMTNDNTV